MLNNGRMPRNAARNGAAGAKPASPPAQTSRQKLLLVVWVPSGAMATVNSATSASSSKPDRRA